MNQSTNLLLMLLPKALLGPVLLLTMAAGGLAIVVGARRLGQALVVSAIMFPIGGIVSAGLMNSVASALPLGFAALARLLAAVAIFLMLGWALIRWVFGQKAIDHAKGEILADGARYGIRLLFSRVGLVACVGFAAVVLLKVN